MVPLQFKKQNKKNPNQYDQEMPQSQTIDQPIAPRGRNAEHSHPHDIKNTMKVKQPALSS